MKVKITNIGQIVSNEGTEVLYSVEFLYEATKYHTHCWGPEDLKPMVEAALAPLPKSKDWAKEFEEMRTFIGKEIEV